MSEWQPGDVVSAFIGSRQRREIAAYCGDKKYPWRLLTSTFGNGRCDEIGAINVTDIRRLVVIDPEDREQVERLANEYTRQWCGTKAIVETVDQIQAALREFAQPQPVKPEEPTGLGAVVEDAAGEQYLRCFGDPEYYVWRRKAGFDNTRYKYAEIDVVRVLSEGVTE